MRASVLLPLLLLSLSLSLSLAEDDLPHALFGFSGNWESTGTMYLPSWSSDGTCTVGTTLYHYAWFNYTFNGDGVRRFSSMEDFDYVFAYKNGFNPAAPCQGTAMMLSEDGSSSPYDYDSYTFFTSGVTYTFVIIDYSTYGPFTGQITEGWQGATSNATGMMRNPIYIDSSGCNLEDQGDNKPYYTKMWFNVSSTGYYDVSAYFARTANNYPSYTYLTLYKGNPNASLETDGCGPVGDGVELIAAEYHSYQLVTIMQVRLVAGVTYWAVVSTYNNDFWGPFGFEVTTTRRFNFTLPVTTTSTTVGGFNEPPRDSTHYGVPGFNCISNTGGYDNRAYAVITFNVPSNYNFTVYTTEPHDYAFFLYSGENINPPTACLSTGRYLDYVDSGSDRTYGPYSADDYTIVATPWSSSGTGEGYYVDVYVTYGAPITSGGPAPVVTTTTGNTPVTSTTGNTPVSTTGVNPVTSTTGNRPITTTTGNRPVTTTSTSGRPTPPASTTNSAGISARFASAALLVAAVFALLM